MLIVQTIRKNSDSLIRYLANKNIYNYKLGLSRSILTLGTFLTLIFNDTELLFSNPNKSSNLYTGDLFVLQKINFFYLLPFNYIYILKYVAICILMIVVIGWRPRYTCIFHFWICISFNYSTTSIEGGDQIVSNLSFLLIPILLLDGRKWHWQNIISPTSTQRIQEKNLIGNFFHLIIKLQMCFIYLNAAIGKTAKKDWTNGTATYYWLNDPIFGLTDWLRPLMNPILSNALGVSALTWGCIAIELLLFMAITMKSSARFCLLIVGLAFHFMIIVFHGLFSFFFAMAGGLLLYLWVDNRYGKIRLIEGEDV